jgi:hypothetical protein
MPSRKDACPVCGNPKDTRAATCFACRDWSQPATASGMVAEALAHAEHTAEGCLLDTLRTPWHGYVTVEVAGQSIKLPRLVMAEHLGRPLTADETVDHTCHNRSDCDLGNDCPHRRCINVEHLEVIDQPTNWRRGRQGAVAKRRAITHCPAGHLYAGRNLYVIPSTNGRSCRACARARAAGRDPREEVAVV